MAREQVLSEGRKNLIRKYLIFEFYEILITKKHVFRPNKKKSRRVLNTWAIRVFH